MTRFRFSLSWLMLPLLASLSLAPAGILGAGFSAEV